jgi:hypothetical protein
MEGLPQPSFGRRRHRRKLFALATVALLSGCGTPNDDFGRLQPYLVRDEP